MDESSLKSISPLSSLSLVITAYNEEEALPKLIAEVVQDLKTWSQLELILVNDGSSDQTASVMTAIAETYQDQNWLRIHLIHLDENRGMGAALKKGFAAASLPWVSFLPGDGQIEPRMLRNLGALAHPQVSLITTRYTNRKYGLYRKIISKGLRVISFMILWTNITSEGMYLIRRDRLAQLNLISDSFMLNLEIPIRIAQAKERIEVANIEVRERQGGVSHATALQRIFSTFKDLIILRWYIWREKQTKNTHHSFKP